MFINSDDHDGPKGGKMLKVKKSIGVGLGVVLAMSLVSVTGAQAASNMVVCKSKTGNALTVKTKCSSSENRLSFASLKGAKGDTGAAGAAGAKGDKGDDGAAGEPGLKGDKGDEGAAGEPGLKGDKGDEGAAGEPGLKGDKGDKGDAAALPVAGDLCQVELTPGALNPIAGEYAWVEDGAASGVYTLGCDTN